MTIGKAAPTVSVTGGVFTYDGAAHPATGTVTGVGGAAVGSLTFTYNGSAIAPVGAGAYDVIGSFAGNANYASASGTRRSRSGRPLPRCSGTSHRRSSTARALGAAQLNASAMCRARSATHRRLGRCSRRAPAASLSVTFTPADAVNYNGASAATTIDVAPAPLTIRGTDATKRFGAPLPALSAAGIGFVNGDSMASLSGTLNLATSAHGAERGRGLSDRSLRRELAELRDRLRQRNAVGHQGRGRRDDRDLAGAVRPRSADDVHGLGRGGRTGGRSAGRHVSFFDGSTLLGTAALSGGSAVLTTAGLPAGARTFVARYNGDGSFETGSAAASHVIRDATMTPALTITSSRNPSTVGQSVTLTANVSMPAGAVTGNVEFYSGATLLATRAISAGRATLSTTTLARRSAPDYRALHGSGHDPAVAIGRVRADGGYVELEEPLDDDDAVVERESVRAWQRRRVHGQRGRVYLHHADRPHRRHGERSGRRRSGGDAGVRVHGARDDLGARPRARQAHRDGDVPRDATYKGSTAQVAQTVN